MEIFKNVRAASAALVNTTDEKRSEAIKRLADLVDLSHDELLKANRMDLDRMDPVNPLYDRLKLDDARLDAIASGLRDVAALPTPVGEITEHRVLPNGIDLKRVRVPFGVIGIVYEARPNVTFDVFALCLKSANASVLKGGSDADNSNRAAIKLIHRALNDTGLPTDSCVLLPSDHEAVKAMLTAVGYVDVCIPRGGRRLIDFVRDNAKVPVIETGAGVVHTYFDKDGNLAIGRAVIDNGKTRRVSVCNALDTVLVHSARLIDLPELLSPLADKNVEIYADPKAMTELTGHYPAHLLKAADPSHKDCEWMDHKMGVFTVDDIEAAIAHIAAHGSGHSESIVTENKSAAALFCRCVDASCVYVNLPTAFTDGAQFGLGAEIGISTQKLGPRGPMGLREITTYRYVLSGHGQVRP